MALPHATTCWAPGEREAWRAQLPAADWNPIAEALGLAKEVTSYVLGESDVEVTIAPPTGAGIAAWRSQPWLDRVVGLGPGPVMRAVALCPRHWLATREALAGFVAAFEFDAVVAIT